MSYTEIRIGKVKEISFIKNSTFVQKVNSLKAMGYKIDWVDEDDCYIECENETTQLALIGDKKNRRVFEIIEDIEYEPSEDITMAKKENDGTISYVLKYHNGGCCFEEILEEAIEEMEKKK